MRIFFLPLLVVFLYLTNAVEVIGQPGNSLARSSNCLEVEDEPHGDTLTPVIDQQPSAPNSSFNYYEACIGKKGQCASACIGLALIAGGFGMLKIPGYAAMHAAHFASGCMAGSGVECIGAAYKAWKFENELKSTPLGKRDACSLACCVAPVPLCSAAMTLAGFYSGSDLAALLPPLVSSHAAVAWNLTLDACTPPRFPCHSYSESFLDFFCGRADDDQPQ
jgi:hypothetical protein